jgi:hypothetical protein
MRVRSVLAFGLVMFLIPAFADGSTDLEVGMAAPEVKLSAADGTSRSLEAANGSTVLIFYRGLW